MHERKETHITLSELEYRPSREDIDHYIYYVVSQHTASARSMIRPYARFGIDREISGSGTLSGFADLQVSDEIKAIDTREENPPPIPAEWLLKYMAARLASLRLYEYFLEEKAKKAHAAKDTGLVVKLNRVLSAVWTENELTYLFTFRYLCQYYGQPLEVRNGRPIHHADPDANSDYIDAYIYESLVTQNSFGGISHHVKAWQDTQKKERHSQLPLMSLSLAQSPEMQFNDSVRALLVGGHVRFSAIKEGSIGADKCLHMLRINRKQCNSVMEIWLDKVKAEYCAEKKQIEAARVPAPAATLEEKAADITIPDLPAEVPVYSQEMTRAMIESVLILLRHYNNSSWFKAVDRIDNVTQLINSMQNMNTPADILAAIAAHKQMAIISDQEANLHACFFKRNTFTGGRYLAVLDQATNAVNNAVQQNSSLIA